MASTSCSQCQLKQKVNYLVETTTLYEFIFLAVFNLRRTHSEIDVPSDFHHWSCVELSCVQ